MAAQGVRRRHTRKQLIFTKLIIDETSRLHSFTPGDNSPLAFFFSPHFFQIEKAIIRR
jgi:hypothetical protein